MSEYEIQEQLKTNAKPREGRKSLQQSVMMAIVSASAGGHTDVSLSSGMGYTF